MRHAHIGGIRISMEEGAGVDISFSDEDIRREYGVRIVSREEALKYPVVTGYTPLRIADIEKMTKGGRRCSR